MAARLPNPLVDGEYRWGPFMGLSEEEASYFASQYPADELDEDGADEAFRILSADKTVNELVQMWAWMDSKELGVRPMGPYIHHEQLVVGEYIEECKRLDVICAMLILKARQLGMSTFIQNAQYLLAATGDHEHYLTVADIDKKVQGLVAKSHFTQKMLQSRVGYYPKANFTRRRGGEFANGSTLEFASAEEDEPGRSFSYNGNHLSETAFYKRDMQVLAGVSATLKKTGFRLTVQETTANGAGGQFYKAWNEATSISQKSRSKHRAFFFPWFEHESYQMPVTADEEAEIMGSLDKEEVEGIDQFGWTVEQLAWRRHEIHTMLSGDLDKFHQEYPSTPIEAFIQGGRPAFDRNAMLWLSKELLNVEPVFEGDLVA